MKKIKSLQEEHKAAILFSWRNYRREADTLLSKQVPGVLYHGKISMLLKEFGVQKSLRGVSEVLLTNDVKAAKQALQDFCHFDFYRKGSELQEPVTLYKGELKDAFDRPVLIDLEPKMRKYGLQVELIEGKLVLKEDYAFHGVLTVEEALILRTLNFKQCACTCELRGVVQDGKVVSLENE